MRLAVSIMITEPGQSQMQTYTRYHATMIIAAAMQAIRSTGAWSSSSTRRELARRQKAKRGRLGPAPASGVLNSCDAYSWVVTALTSV